MCLGSCHTKTPSEPLTAKTNNSVLKFPSRRYPRHHAQIVLQVAMRMYAAVIAQARYSDTETCFIWPGLETLFMRQVCKERPPPECCFPKLQTKSRTSDQESQQSCASRCLVPHMSSSRRAWEAPRRIVHEGFGPFPNGGGNIHLRSCQVTKCTRRISQQLHRAPHIVL